MICFPCPCFATFCSQICPFLKSALSSFRSFPWLPVLQCLWDVPIVITFLFFHSSLRAKLTKKKKIKTKKSHQTPKKLLAGLVYLLTVTPIACLLFWLYEGSWGLTWTDWVTSWLWGGCSRLPLNMWMTQESLLEKVSLASLAAWGTCAMQGAQVDTVELHLCLLTAAGLALEDFGSAVRLVPLVCVELSVGYSLPILVPE